MSEPQGAVIALDPVALVLHASLPIKVTAGVLVVASTAVWLVGVLKLAQVGRVRGAEQAFQRAAGVVADTSELMSVAEANPSAPGARVVRALAARPAGSSESRLEAAAERAVVAERERLSALMPWLASIASASPFIGLFGTVYGIMDAFVRIGAEKSASLPVVAPAIGEALVTTAVGLAAAIPAVVFYNAVDRRVGDVLAELESAAAEWVALFATGDARPVPLTRRSTPPRVEPGR